MQKHLAVFTMLVGWQVWGATYYIDYAGGANTNDGLSTTAAWKVHPYMKGFNGSYTHHAGDRFIFKGGVTWPNSVFGMTIAVGGSNGNNDYYGVDKTWYAGNSWTRPVFDAQRTVISERRFIGGGSYITLDNLEMTGYYWDATSQGWGTCMVAANSYTVKNCYFHNWSHASSAGGCNDDLRVVTGSGIIDSCVFDGSPDGANSGFASDFSTVRHSVARNMSNGFLPSGSSGLLEVSGCEVGPINDSFDPLRHENSIEQLGGGTIYIHHNYIHHATAVCVFVGNPGNLAYIYNNLFYDTGAIPIRFDSRGGIGTGFVYNNTFIYNGNPLRTNYPGFTDWTVTVSNNHIIGDGATISPNTSNNLVQTTSQATAAGYVAANRYRPAAASAPTVDAGTATVSTVLNDDFFYATRPQGAGWDIGAYEYEELPVDDCRFAVNPALPPLLPNPVKAALFGRYLQARQEVTVCDLAGDNVEINRLSRPGIYIVKDKMGGAFQKVVMMP